MDKDVYVRSTINTPNGVTLEWGTQYTDYGDLILSRHTVIIKSFRKEKQGNYSCVSQIMSHWDKFIRPYVIKQNISLFSPGDYGNCTFVRSTSPATRICNKISGSTNPPKVGQNYSCMQYIWNCRRFKSDLNISVDKV